MAELRIGLLEEYRELIGKDGIKESELQFFLENNSELIPLPFLLNHHLNDNAIITKLPIASKITDFVYLTKSSDEWYVVLIELERSDKKIFLSDDKDIKFSADFNNAMDQIRYWRAMLDIDVNRMALLHSIDKLRVPLNENRVSFKYVLVIGRSSEKEHHSGKRGMFAQLNTEDMRVMTYDSIISYVQSESRVNPKLILSPWKEQGFQAKVVPDDLQTTIFAYCSSEYLNIRAEDIEKLKSYGYDMNMWLAGKSLNLNSKKHVDL